MVRDSGNGSKRDQGPGPATKYCGHEPRPVYQLCDFACNGTKATIFPSKTESGGRPHAFTIA
jgi:hypothetical protein